MSQSVPSMMFKTSEESIILLVEAMCPNLVFVNVPEFIDYSNFVDLFKNLEWSKVDLLMTKTSLSTLNQIIIRNIKVQCPTVIFGDIQDYDQLIEIFEDEWFAYIYMYPNNKKKYAGLVQDNKKTRELLNTHRTRLAIHSKKRPVLVCLV